MKKSLKYIKIEGKLKSRGEYITSAAEYRPYEAVSIIDTDGDEVHFHTLSISKRMDEALDFNKPITFYILRCRVDEKLVGVLYAAESEGEKIYYPDTAIPALEALGLQVRTRSQFIANPSSALMIIAICGGILTSILSYGLRFDGVLAFFFGFGGIATYLYAPMMFKSSGAGIMQMQEILKTEGFSVASSTNAKY